MIECEFTLVPFPAPKIPDISITGNFSFQSSILTLHYTLTGILETILLPPVSDPPSRRDDLWKRTCFEFFLAFKGQPGYWEFNVSPSGDWNVYWMDAYRRIGFREEPGISELRSDFQRALEGCALDVTVDLTSILDLGYELQMAITAIIQTRDGHETYWALTHPGINADFHWRESFVLKLAGQTHPSHQSARDG